MNMADTLLLGPELAGSLDDVISISLPLSKKELENYC